LNEINNAGQDQRSYTENGRNILHKCHKIKK
jgi:hypothetical protein